MLKETVTYTNYDGVEETKELYFNLTRTECIDLNLEYEKEGGLAGHLKELMSQRINGQVMQKPAVDFVKLLIDRAYGVRPKDDPSAFVKEDDDGRPLINKFKRTMAYDTFVYGIMSGEIPLERFAEHVLPAMSEEQKAQAEKMLKEQGYGELVDLTQAKT